MSAVQMAPARSGTFTEATRQNTSVLARVEKRLLVLLAERMPRWVNSDHLTALALAAMAGAGLSYWWAATNPVGLAAATVCLATNWFGDSLDGTLARVRGCQRPRYGFYVDHVVDELGAIFLLGGLALSGYMTPWVAGVLLIAYFLLCIQIFLATHVLGTFRMSFASIGPTELRVLLAIGNAVVLFHPHARIAGRDLLLFDAGGLIGAAGLAVTFIVSAIGNTRRLARLEPRPPLAR